MVPPLSPLSFMHERVYADQQTVWTGPGHGQNVQALPNERQTAFNRIVPQQYLLCE